MRRGTTPTIRLTIDENLVDWVMYLSFYNGNTVTTFEDDRLTKSLNVSQTIVEVTLTQEETLAFSTGSVEVQIRAINNGVAVATDIQKLPVNRIILDGVING